MFVEFRNLLGKTAASLYGNEIPEFSVLECPHSECGELSTNLAIILSKQLVTHELPIDIARKIIDEVGNQDSFQLSIGGGGFINAKVHDSLKNEIVAHLANGSYILDAPFSFEELQQSLNSLEQRANDPILLELTSVLKHSEEGIIFDKWCMAKGGYSVSDVVMFLALLGDNEIESSTYINRLKNSDNVVWFLEHTKTCIENWEKRNSEPRVQNFEFRNRKPERSTEEFLLMPLLHYRNQVFSTKRSKRPDRYVRFLLDLAREFIHFYNDPRKWESGIPLERVQALRNIIVSGSG